MAETAVALGNALLSPQQLADYLGVPVATVYRWRYESTCPRGIKVGKHVRYRQQDVEAWLRRGATRTSRGATMAWIRKRPGVTVRALADYLGHVDPGFTLRVYAHLMPAAEGRARAAIDAALGSSAGQMRAKATEEA
jgi:excisionase family DNA binding protein